MTDQQYRAKLDIFKTELVCSAPDLSIREKAEEIGISHATLHRIVQGKIPTLRVYLQVCEWLTYLNEENGTEEA